MDDKGEKLTACGGGRETKKCLIKVNQTAAGLNCE